MYTKKEADLRVGTNLDWLIEEMKALEQRVTALEEQVNGNAGG